MTSATAEAADISESGTVTLPERPYPGLRPFHASEWPIYFGNERMADEILDRLMTQHLLVLHGDSGCGKSSLINAGVLPRLGQEGACWGIEWHTATARPGDSPLWNVASALASTLPDGNREENTLAFRRTLNFGRDAPHAIVELLQTAGRRHVCLLLDQFEELFDHARRRGGEEATLLNAVLCAFAAEPPPGLYIAITMRSEYLGACGRFAGLSEVVNHCQYLLPAMNRNDMLRAIMQPALLYGGEVTQALADRLLADTSGGTDKLPVLQHALMFMHRQCMRESADRVAGGWTLDTAHFPRHGGLAGLLSNHADEVMAEALTAADLSGDSRVVEDLFRAITDTNADRLAIRRPQHFADLVEITGAEPAQLDTVINTFCADGASFLVRHPSPESPGRDRIDIGHEALIRCWNKLAEPGDGWLTREFNNGLVWKSLLVQADSFDRDSNNILSPATTAERAKWMIRRNAGWAARYGGGWERVSAMIDASRTAAEQAAAQAKKLRRLRLGFVVVTIAALITGIGAVYSVARYYDGLDQQNREIASRLQAQVETLQQELIVAAENARSISEATLALNSNTGETTPGDVSELVTQAQQQATTLSDLETQITTGAKVNPGRLPSQTSAIALRPRMYIQIAAEAQRSAAQTLQKLLLANSQGDAGLMIPGIELVSTAPGESVLRCFRAEECGNEAQQLVAAINRLLIAPKIKLEDLSKRYQDGNTVRTRHYELWFASGDIKVNTRNPITNRASK